MEVQAAAGVQVRDVNGSHNRHRQLVRSGGPIFAGCEKSRMRARIVLMGVCIAANAVFQACGDRHEYSYATVGEAIKAGEITRGWIPDYLPASSRAIHIAYDPSSPRT